jgi:hypothetical protein
MAMAGVDKNPIHDEIESAEIPIYICRVCIKVLKINGMDLDKFAGGKMTLHQTHRFNCHF